MDRSEPLDNHTFSDIYQALHDHAVNFFRDQTLTQHYELTQRFGKLMAHPYVHGIEGFPEVIEIVKEPSEIRNWGGDWHADLTCRFQWRPGSMAIWDNRAVLHNALSDDFGARGDRNGFRRVLHRATLAGDRPV